MPGFLTVNGFHKVLLPALPSATREVASESWVMGQKVPANLDPAQQAELQNSVVKLYLDDYAKAWDGVLQDLEIVPLRSLNQAAQDLYVLASPQSPMKDLLTDDRARAHAVGAAQAHRRRGGGVGSGCQSRRGDSLPGDVARCRRAFLGACRPARCGAGAAARP